MTAMRRQSAWAALVYGAMIVGVFVAFLAVQRIGETLTAIAPVASDPRAFAAPANDVLWHLLLALTAVVIAGQCLGAVFRWIGQPPVIGQIVAGILLGPSMLGRLAPHAS